MKAGSHDNQILKLRREVPEFSYTQIALIVGCSRDQARHVCNSANLGEQWKQQQIGGSDARHA